MMDTQNDNSNGENRDEPLDLGVPYVQTHVCLWLMSLSSLSPRVWIDWTSSYTMITRLLCTSMHHSPWGSSVVSVCSWSFCGLCGLVNHEVPVKNALSLARPRRELSCFRWKNWRTPWTSLRPIFLDLLFYLKTMATSGETLMSPSTQRHTSIWTAAQKMRQNTETPIFTRIQDTVWAWVNKIGTYFHHHVVRGHSPTDGPISLGNIDPSLWPCYRSTEFERLAQVGAHASSLSLIGSTIWSSFAHFLHRSFSPLHQFGVLLTVGDPCIARFLLSWVAENWAVWLSKQQQLVPAPDSGQWWTAFSSTLHSETSSCQETMADQASVFQDLLAGSATSLSCGWMVNRFKAPEPCS